MAFEIPALVLEIKSARTYKDFNTLNTKWDKKFPDVMAKLRYV